MDKYLVVGNPIAHSKSPDIHAEFARLTQQDISYERFLGDLESFETQIKDFFEQGGKGFNVTVPFKERAFALCDVLSSRAKTAGAVNTLLQNQNGEIYGDNTDGIGMVRDIKVNNSQTMKGKRILVLGAGGAVRGILEPVLSQKPSELVIANRTVSKAQTLVDIFGPEDFPDTKRAAMGFAEVEGEFDMIINGTSASLSGDLPPIPDTVIGVNTWCYDMMYAKEPTVFLNWAQNLGAKGCDGLGMLVEQAAEAFTLWRNKRPETLSLINKMHAEL
ncbi:shikimate dehydrogenase [Marinomonas sp. PE14-40]|uniref:shikimate dehydrogenase n=1 Tax=Marinomonas sp. PE14-40 TaxID=3060621 RepID=UPI003F66D5CE